MTTDQKPHRVAQPAEKEIKHHGDALQQQVDRASNGQAPDENVSSPAQDTQEAQETSRSAGVPKP